MERVCVMDTHTIDIPIYKEKKILLISDIKYSANNKTYYFKSNLKFFSYESLFEIIKLLKEKYEDYQFWWLDGHEVAIVLWDGVEFDILLKVFKDLDIEDRLFFVDNNLGESKYEKKFNKIKTPFLIGWTSKYGFDISPRKFEKKFICLNRTPKIHRKEIFTFLKLNYQEESFLSYGVGWKGLTEKYVFDTEDDMEYGNLYSAYPHESQTKSFCNIVTESIVDNGPIHITEKTDKCFSAGQPFIIIGGPYYLKKLKELGFQTFDKWWDESYDLEEDYRKRMFKIKSTIHQIAKWGLDECEQIYQEMIPILEHNKKLSATFDDELCVFLNYWYYNDKVEFTPKNNFLKYQSLI